MKNLTAPAIPLALALLAVAAVALRAAARRPKPPQAPGTRLAPVMVTAGQSRPPPVVTIGAHDGTRGEMARLPASMPYCTASTHCLNSSRCAPWVALVASEGIAPACLPKVR